VGPTRKSTRREGAVPSFRLAGLSASNQNLEHHFAETPVLRERSCASPQRHQAGRRSRLLGRDEAPGRTSSPHRCRSPARPRGRHRGWQPKGVYRLPDRRAWDQPTAKVVAVAASIPARCCQREPAPSRLPDIIAGPPGAAGACRSASDPHRQPRGARAAAIEARLKQIAGSNRCLPRAWRCGTVRGPWTRRTFSKCDTLACHSHLF
jgi:hypothetical protein